MTHFPSIDEIEIAWKKSPGGLCILVEGETDLDDPWFYNQWFGNEAKRFTFFTQDGWKQVENAVLALRKILGCQNVYGIIDRDFCKEILVCTIDPTGLVRTRKYTLENYLLDPAAWSQYMGRMRNPERKAGWETVADATATILSMYQDCIPVAAFNSFVVEILESQKKITPELNANLHYFDHPLSSIELEASKEYLVIQKSGILPTFRVDYQQRIQTMQSMPLEQLETLMSGKLVLKVFARYQSPFVTRGGWTDLLGEIAGYTSSPIDIQQILDLIWNDSYRSIGL